MGIHQPPIRSRSRVSSAPSYKFFGRDHQKNLVDRDGRVRFQICSVEDAMLVGFFPFSKAAWEGKKARKLELSSFVFPRNVKDTCPVLARLSPLQTSRHLPLLFPLPSLLFPQILFEISSPKWDCYSANCQKVPISFALQPTCV